MDIQRSMQRKPERPLALLRSGRYAGAHLRLAVGLLAVSLSAHSAWAVDRALRLHSSSRAPAYTHTSSEPRHSKTQHGATTHGSREAAAPHRGAARDSKATRSSGASKQKLQPRSHGKRHEPEIVDDPPLLHRAENQTGRGLTRHELAQERLADLRKERRGQGAHTVRSDRHGRTLATRETSETRAASVARAASVSYPALKRPFSPALSTYGTTRLQPLRAISISPHASAAAQPSPLPQSNEDNEALLNETLAAAASVPTSVVIRKPSAPQAFVSDATPGSGALQPRVVTGFGAEVAPISATAPTHTGSASVSPSPAPLGSLAKDPAATRELAEDAMQPMVLPIYRRDGQLMMPAPLKGSHDILVHQNMMADNDGLERIQSDRDLDRMREQRLLVGFPETASLRINEGLPENRRYARPWTVKFAGDIGRAFYAAFGEPIQVNSAVRTVSYQRRLQRVNGNAAATDGDGASPHLTGQAIDLAKRGMSSGEIAWMRTYLLPFIESGKIDVEEEFQQACFHISVYRAYMPARHTVQVAQLHTVEPKSQITTRTITDPEQ